jgi:hypothetical protein
MLTSTIQSRPNAASFQGFKKRLVITRFVKARRCSSRGAISGGNSVMADPSTIFDDSLNN